MITAALVVESTELTLRQINRAMAQEPDAGHDRGSLSPIRTVPRERTTWSVGLTWAPDVHGGTEGLATAIEAIGPGVADRLAGLVARGCDVVVSVRQDIAGTSESLGFHLTPGAIKWLAAATAALDVDQYVVDESEAP